MCEVMAKGGEGGKGAVESGGPGRAPEARRRLTQFWPSAGEKTTLSIACIRATMCSGVSPFCGKSEEGAERRFLLFWREEGDEGSPRFGSAFA